MQQVKVFMMRSQIVNQFFNITQRTSDHFDESGPYLGLASPTCSGRHSSEEDGAGLENGALRNILDLFSHIENHAASDISMLKVC